jgi:hypothetical protein
MDARHCWAIMILVTIDVFACVHIPYSGSDFVISADAKRSSVLPKSGQAIGPLGDSITFAYLFLITFTEVPVHLKWQSCCGRDEPLEKQTERQ